MPIPYSLLSTVIPPSGVEYAAFLPFTPSTLHPLPVRPTSTLPLPPGRVVSNLVCARGRRLRIFEVWEEEESVGEPGTRVKVEQGKLAQPKSLRLRHLISHTLHGTITGLAPLRTLASSTDGLSRLVVSYEEAKLAILEWNDDTRALQTVSLHTYERTPQVAQGDLTGYIALLRIDPGSRCAVLLLPGNSLAVLPILGDGVEDLNLEYDDEGKDRREIPYSPSFTVDFSALDPRIRNVKDMVFLPGFHSPTIAILYSERLSWENRQESERDCYAVSFHALDPTSQTRPSNTIATISSLPTTSLSLFPCPTSLPGVLLLTPNALIHVDPSGNAVATAVNGFHQLESSLPADEAPGVSGLRLEGSRVIFLEEGKDSTEEGALLFLSDGSVRSLKFEQEGQRVLRIWVGQEILGMGPSPSEVVMTSLAPPGAKKGTGAGTLAFVGSQLGDGALLRIAREIDVLVKRDMGGQGPAADMGMNVDEDLYGPSDPFQEAAAEQLYEPDLAGVMGQGELKIELCDTLKDHGSIMDLTFGAVLSETDDSNNEPQLLVVAGAGLTASFNYFHRDMPAAKRRRLNQLQGARALWSIRVPVRGGGAVPERDTMLVVDENHASGHTKIFSKGTPRGRGAQSGEPQILRRIPAATITAGSFFQRTCLAHVTRSSVSLIEGDGRERQSISAPKGVRFIKATISDPYVLVHRDDGRLALFVGDTIRGKFEEVAIPLDKGVTVVASSIYSDTSGVFTTLAPTSVINPLSGDSAPGTTGASSQEAGDAMDDDHDEDLYGKAEPKPSAVEVPPPAVEAEDVKLETVASLESVMDTGKGKQWLCLCLSDGRLEIRALRSLDVVFSFAGISAFPTVLRDDVRSQDVAMTDETTEVGLERPPVHQMLIAPIGVDSPRPHLLFITHTGLLIVYEASTIFSPPPTSSSSSRSSLAVRFVKTISRAIRPADDPDEPTPSIPWSLEPFTGLRGLTGVFLTGDLPFWILREDASPVTLYGVDERMVHSFAPTTVYGETQDEYALITDDGPTLYGFPADIEVSQPLPVRRIPSGRTYTHVAFDTPSRHTVAAGVFSVPFQIFDEDDNRIEVPEPDPNLLPLTERSSLELIDWTTGEVVHGFEFDTNEVVLDMKSVNLETKSTPLGRKDYIAVGTGISRGEDLAERGATYIFEVVEVVPDLQRPDNRYKLKLLCKDYSKGAVTAISSLNGYLVSAVAQKLYVRGFDFDERLLGVAFLDISIYTTTITTLKNLIILGDAVRSIWFVAFQEDPFKLVLLGKDTREQHVSTADFLVSDGKVGFVVTNPKGDVRLLEYNPLHPDAEAGQKLLYRSEVHMGSEASSVVTIARRTTEAELIAPQSELVYAGMDGSISTLIAVPEATYKRLTLLQGQLLRSIQHVSGLNPKAFRTVRNDHVSRPLLKGVLDGDALFDTFELLTGTKQREITKQIGTSVEDVLDDLEMLRAVW